MLEFDSIRTKPVSTQNKFLHDVLSPMNPATMGPTAGPANGAIVKIAIAFPRMSASKMSDRRALSKVSQGKPQGTGGNHPVIVSGAAAKVPPRNRNIRMEAVFGASAVPIWKHCLKNA